MQTIKSISVSNGKPDIFLPLFFIVVVSAFKDLFEDIKRHRADTEENTKACHVVDPNTGKLLKKSWKQVRVGNIVKVYKNYEKNLILPYRLRRTSMFLLIY